MSNDKELRRFFETGKTEIPDNGFSKKVIKRLPEKVNVLPQLIIMCFTLMGFGAVVAIQGFSLFLENIESMIMAMNSTETFPFLTLMTYFVNMLIMASVSYTLYQSNKI
jgi:hypothetical protein